MNTQSKTYRLLLFFLGIPFNSITKYFIVCVEKIYVNIQHCANFSAQKYKMSLAHNIPRALWVPCIIWTRNNFVLLLDLAKPNQTCEYIMSFFSMKTSVYNIPPLHFFLCIYTYYDVDRQLSLCFCTVFIVHRPTRRILIGPRADIYDQCQLKNSGGGGVSYRILLSTVIFFFSLRLVCSK